MSNPNDNGGDWGTPQQQGPAYPQPGAMQPAPRPPGQPGMSDGMGSADDSTALFPSVKAHIGQAFGAIKGAPLKIFLGISALVLVLHVVTFMFALLLGAMDMYMGWGQLLGGIIQTGGVVISVAAATVQLALFRPIRHVMRGGQLGSLGEVFAMAKPQLIPAFVVNLIFGVVVGLGTMCCVIPGIIAGLLFLPARYLAGGRGLDIGDALSTSIEIGKKYWLLLGLCCVLFAVLIGMAAAFGGGVGAGLGIFAASLAPSAGSGMGIAAIFGGTTFATGVLGWIAGTASSIILWTVEAGVMSAIEEDYFPGENTADVFQ